MLRAKRCTRFRLLEKYMTMRLNLDWLKQKLSTRYFCMKENSSTMYSTIAMATNRRNCNSRSNEFLSILIGQLQHAHLALLSDWTNSPKKYTHDCQHLKILTSEHL